MFCFRTRIVDDIARLTDTSIDEFNRTWGTIYGEIELTIGEFSLKMINASEVHGDPPQGTADLGSWLDCFLEMLLSICGSGGYAAFRQFDLNLVWFVAERYHDQVMLYMAKDKGITICGNRCDFTNELKGYFYTEKPNALVPDTKKVCMIELNHFYNCIVSEVERFLEQLKEINPNLQESKMYLRYQAKLEQVNLEYRKKRF